MSQVDITNEESSNSPTVAQALPDLESKVLSASTTSLEIPILEDYPPEILTLIFSLIEQDEINLHSPNLAPFYLPKKYSKINLRDWDDYTLPYLFTGILPVYLEAEWFRPKILHISSVAQFRRYPSLLLEMIKGVHLSFPITEEEDYERLSKMENIEGFYIDGDGNKSNSIPNSVLHLVLVDAKKDMQFPTLRTLEICSGSTLKAWPQLTFLAIHKSVMIDFLVKFPMSLVYLDFYGSEIPEYTNLGYLTNLRTLKIALIKNVELPTTIRNLTCAGEEDLTRFHHLEVVDVYHGYGNFLFPDTIRDIRLYYCHIGGWYNLSELGKLKYLYIQDTVVYLRAFKVEYPLSLKVLNLKYVLLSSLETKSCPIRNISISNIAKLNLISLDFDQDADLGSLEALSTTFNERKVTSPQQLHPNVREFSLDSGVFNLSSMSFSGSTLSRLDLTTCKIYATSPVQLPSTLREIHIVSCGLTSEKWSKFICPLKLKILDLLKNKLTEFVECPPELRTLNLLKNNLTEFVEFPPELEVLDLLDNNLSVLGALNPSITKLVLEGNKLYADAIPGYRALVPLRKELSPNDPTAEELISYRKIEEIGFVYLVYKVRLNNMQCSYVVISKNGIQRMELFSES